MKLENPVVSVIIPCFNSAEYIREAVESIVNQSNVDVEVIVVNDGSTDDSKLIILELQEKFHNVRMVDKNNGGLSSARNAGIRESLGHYISFLDADDILYDNKIYTQLMYLIENPDIGLVYSDYCVGDAAGKPIEFKNREMPAVGLQKLYLYRNWFAPFCPLIRRSVVERVGFFDEELDASEDWDYWIRCANETTVGYVSFNSGIYRTHPGQMTKNNDRMYKSWDKLIKKHFTGDEARLANASRNLFKAKSAYARSRYFESSFYLIKSLYLFRSLNLLFTANRILK